MNALLLAMALSSVQDRSVFHLTYLRPSTLLAEIKGERPRWYLPITSELTLSGGAGPYPELQADDEKGTITVVGGSEAIDETIKILKEFDVPRTRARIEVGIKSRLDKYETEFTANLLNNGTARFGDGETGIELQITPRFNGDGSTTASIDLKDDSVDSRFAIRIDKGGTVRFGVGTSRVTWDGSASLVSSTPFGGGKFITEQPKHTPPNADIEVSIQFLASH